MKKKDKPFAKIIEFESEQVLQDLKILAVKANKDLKNYIQDLLIEHTIKNK